MDEVRISEGLETALRKLVARLEETPEALRGPFIVKGLKPYLPAALRAQADAKPVAWWVRNESGSRSYIHDREAGAKAVASDWHDATITPLYARSALEPHPAPVEQMAEALRPFAEASRRFDDAAIAIAGEVPAADIYPLTKFSHADLRRARAALQTYEEQSK